MDNSPYQFYQVNKFFLFIIGRWPYQKSLSKYFWHFYTIFFLATQGALQVGGLIAARVNLPIFLEALPPVIISGVCVVAFINVVYNDNKMRLLYDKMISDWSTTNDEEELKILSKWAKDSRKNSILIASVVYGSMVPFMSAPLFPIVMKLLPENLLAVPENATLPRPILFHVEYLVDLDKYYYPVVIHSYFGTIVYCTVVVATDSMFNVYVQHACAIFEIIGYRLENILESNDVFVNINMNINDDKPYKKIISCIMKHSRILEFARLIESANSISFFFQLGLNMICISFTGFQAAMQIDQPEEAFRYASFAIAQISHLFFESWPGQRLVDASTRISEYTFVTLAFILNYSVITLINTRSMWYLTSMRTRKLMQVLIMRSMEPCLLTAGSFFVLNLQNFSMVVKTSMSYFTVLCSTQ